jgi:hypothetical protein
MARLELLKTISANLDIAKSICSFESLGVLSNEMARKDADRPKPRRTKKAKPPWAEFLNQKADPRPLWRRVDSKSGLPLWEAMLFYGNQSDAEVVNNLTFQGFGDPPYMPLEEMPEAEEKEYRMNSWILSDRRHRMEAEFTWMLRRGEVTATGYSRHSPLDMPATMIIPDRWRLLEPDFTNSSASGPGGDIAGILIFERPKTKSQGVNAPTSFSPAKLRDWYTRYVLTNEESGTSPSRDEDLAAARAVFGSTIPRSALRQLRKDLAPKTWTHHGRRKTV